MGRNEQHIGTRVDLLGHFGIKKNMDAEPFLVLFRDIAEDLVILIFARP